MFSELEMRSGSKMCCFLFYIFLRNDGGRFEFVLRPLSFEEVVEFGVPEAMMKCILARD